MPSIRIVTGDWAFGREDLLIDGVQAALTAALGVPDWNRDIVVDAYDARHRAVPTGHSERFTRIEIALPPVGSPGAKRALYAALVERLECPRWRPRSSSTKCHPRTGACAAVFRDRRSRQTERNGR